MTHAWEPIDEALAEHVVGTAVADGIVLANGPEKATPAGPPRPMPTRSSAAELSLVIAIGIGLHNFAEGLAIGNQPLVNCPSPSCS